MPKSRSLRKLLPRQPREGKDVTTSGLDTVERSRGTGRQAADTSLEFGRGLELRVGRRVRRPPAMGMKDLTPTERAQLHARQRAAKEARQRSAHSPGPGQYDLDKVDRYGANATLSDMRGEGTTTWSFISQSKQRGSVVGGKAQSGHVGPGAYTPQRTKTGENDTLACGRGDGNFASATINSKVPRGSPYGPSTAYAQNKFEDGPHVPSAASYSPQQDSHRRWSHKCCHVHPACPCHW